MTAATCMSTTFPSSMVARPALTLTTMSPVNAVRLRHDVTGDEKIHHIDILSLYPTVNKHEAYPVGHPETIVSDFRDARECFCVVKCIVNAPTPS